MNVRRTNADVVPGSVDIRFMHAEIQEDGKIRLAHLSHMDSNKT